MTRTRAAAVLIALAAFAVTAAPRATATGEGPDPWFGTFSIIAVDPATGELGVGVALRDAHPPVELALDELVPRRLARQLGRPAETILPAHSSGGGTMEQAEHGPS